ncbi:MAG: hypothetical protein J3K34DRAFT_433646 [Monoraphidium minutum]|nr:MAG: hypothetical protein J3K34DRAFT_433646 [Monoraphidium minutum]
MAEGGTARHGGQPRMVLASNGFRQKGAGTRSEQGRSWIASCFLPCMCWLVVWCREDPRMINRGCPWCGTVEARASEHKGTSALQQPPQRSKRRPHRRGPRMFDQWDGRRCSHPAAKKEIRMKGEIRMIRQGWCISRHVCIDSTHMGRADMVKRPPKDTRREYKDVRGRAIRNPLGIAS